MKRFIIGIIKFAAVITMVVITAVIVCRVHRRMEIVDELNLNQNTIHTSFGHTFNYTYKQKSYFLLVYDLAQLYYKHNNNWVLVDTMKDVEPELKVVYSNNHYVVYCEKTTMQYYVVFMDSNKIVNLTDEICDVLLNGEKAVFQNKILHETKDFIVNHLSTGNDPPLNRRYLVIKEYLK